MSNMIKVAKNLKKALDDSEKRKPNAYDTEAEVVGAEDNSLWVKFPGGETSTPIRKTMDAKPGDKIMVRVSGHRAWAVGNETNPPTDDTRANAVAIAAQPSIDFVKALEDRDVTVRSIAASTGYINDLYSKNITTENIRATTGYIADLTSENITADNIIADHETVGSLDANYAHISNGVIDNAKISYADVNNLNAHYAHITNGVIDNAKIGYADVDHLDAHYAEIDLANVDNAWIENGAIKKAEVFDENVFDLSGDHATLSRIDASKINVANLRADNLVVRRINGQPVVGGYTLIDSNSSGYASKNPQALGWYEFVNAQWVLSTDTTVDMTKAYYQTGNEVSLYDQQYINNLKHELNQRIDGAVESFTGTVVPTLTNWPYTDWYDTSVTPVHDERANHVGDIYYVVNAASEQDGYAYRFAFDNTTNAYDWVLIRDTDITKALSDISELQTFESETTSWIDETDEGIETIRTNHTALAGVVDKTVKESIQLWFTKANTTAPTKPNSTTYPNGVTDASTAGNGWRKVVPAYNSSYPNYYYCWQYKFVDGTFAWSDVVRDIAMGETQGTARDAKNTADAALPASTFETFESTTFTNLVDEVDEQSTTMTNMTTRLGLNSDGTGANTDIVAKESALETTVDGISTRVGKTETKLIGMYATSSTAAGTAAKVATITPALPSGATWELGTGTIITVKFTNANTTSSPTLNVNSKGAKAIKTYANGNLSEAEYKWAAGSTFTFVYNGTNWLMQDSSVSVRINSAETGITQNAEAITLEASKREASVNLLLDSDAPSLDKVYASENRYWSDASATAVTPSLVEMSDPPVQGMVHAARFVCDGTNTSDVQRAHAFYTTNNNVIPLIAGQTYTATWWARCTSGSGKTRCQISGKGGTVSFSSPIYDLTSEWKMFSLTVTVVELNTNYNRVWFYSRFPANTAGTVEICGCKLIAGDSIDAYKTTIEQTADNVLIKATRTGATTAEQQAGGTSAAALINVAPDTVKIAAKHVEITGTAVFNAVDADANAKAAMLNSELEIGGRNLLVGTGISISKSTTSTSGYVTQSLYETPNQAMLSELGFVANDEVTLSFDWAISDATVYGNARIEWYGKKSSSEMTYLAALINPFATFSASNTSGHVETTVKLTSTTLNAKRLVMRIDNSNLTVTISNLRLERGNKATDWTPAPEDVQAEIDAKKSAFTINATGTDASQPYSQILAWAQDGRQLTWAVDSTAGIKVGDTVRIKTTVSNMSNAPVYVVTTCRETPTSSTSIKTTSHGLDTTIIDGGNILTNSIGANQIASNAITANKIRIGDFNNYVTVTETDENTLISPWTIVDGWLYKPASTVNAWVTNKQPRWVTSGESYRVTGIAKAPATGCVLVIIRGRDASGTNKTSRSLTTEITTANANTTINGIITINDDLAQYPQNSIDVIFCTTDTWTANYQEGYIKQLKVERMSGGELIVDGAITVGKMNSDTRSQVLNSNIQVGGKNLLRNTANVGASGSYWPVGGWYSSGGGGTITTGVSIDDSPIGIATATRLTSTNATKEIGAAQGGVPFVGGKTITLSAWVKGTAGDQIRFQPVWANASSTVPEGGSQYFTIADSDNNKWVKYSYTKTVDYDHPIGNNASSTTNTYANAGYVMLYHAEVGHTALVTGVKLEYGNKATDWTPAPEDGINDNLLIDTQKMSAWYANSNVTIDTTGEFGVATLAGTSSAWRDLASRPTIRASILDGTPLYLSFEYKASVTTNLFRTMAGTANVEGSPTLGSRTKYNGGTISLPAATSWTRYTESLPYTTIDSLNAGSGSVNSLYLQLYNRTDDSTLQIRKVKLEHGVSATNWTPSAEEQKTYITRINDTGINIHPANSSGNDFLAINSTSIDFLRNNVSTLAMTDSDLRLGKSASPHVRINASGMNVYTGTESTSTNVAFYGDTIRLGSSTGQRVTLSSTALEMYDQNNQRRVRVNSGEGVTIGRPDKGRAVITDQGMTIYDVNNTDVAFYGDTARIGPLSSANLTLTTQSGYYPKFSLFAKTTNILSLTGNVYTNPNSDYNTYGSVSFLPGLAPYTACGIYFNGNLSNGYGEAQFTGAGTNRGIACLNAEDENHNSISVRCYVGGNYGSGRIESSRQIQVTSDRRLKEHLSYLQEDAIGFIRSLKPAYFKIYDACSLGFYAQDVEESDKWHVLVGTNEDGVKSLNYTGIIAPLVAYCQHLETRIEELERR